MLQRGVHRTRAGVVAPVAQAVNVLGNVTMHRRPIASSRCDSHREAPRRIRLHLRFHTAEQWREQHGLHLIPRIERKHQSESRIFQRWQPEAAFARVGNECGAAFARGNEHARQFQIGFGENEIATES